MLAIGISGLLLGGGGPASAGGGTTTGPVQINPVGHPRLCWQAAGNGVPILLEDCNSALPSQQWSLTPGGVLMNGIGSCLEAHSGHPDGVPLDIDFADRCGGAPGQVWRYNGKTGHLSSLGTCAALGGPVSPGTQVVRSACPRGPRWSIGYSAVTLKAGTGTGPPGGAFDASVTVANASSAQAAYEVTVAFGLPGGLVATGVRATGGVSGWRCDRPALTCTGTVLAGTSGRIGLSGRLPADARPGGSYVLTARAVVRGTSQLHGMPRASAPVTVSVRPAAPVARGAGVPLPAIVLAALLIGGGLLAGLTLRGWTATATDYHGRRRRPAHRPLRRPRLLLISQCSAGAVTHHARQPASPHVASARSPPGAATVPGPVRWLRSGARHGGGTEGA